MERQLHQALAVSLGIIAICCLGQWLFSSAQGSDLQAASGDTEFFASAAPPVIIAATEEALTQLKWEKLSATASHSKACLEGETASGAPLVIQVNAVDYNLYSDVRLQVGTSWSDNAAECSLLRDKILQNIQHKLR